MTNRANRAWLSPTPGPLAGLREVVDTACPRMRPLTATGLIAAIYLLFFAVGILTAIHVLRLGIVLNETDYASFRGIAEVVSDTAEILGATAILALVVHALAIPRSLAGLPHYPTSPIPSLLTVLIATGGLAAATIVRAFLEDPGAGPNNDGGGIVSNPAALLSLVSALSAGVVEEVVIVAVPVLLGRRAGWNPLLIIAGCAVLRVPFHLYQGAAAVPWALIWGAAYATAYMYLRRLLPLIAVHALVDATVMLNSAYGPAGRFTALVVALLALAALALRTVPDRRRRLNPDAPTATRAAARIAWRQTPTSTRATYAGLAVLVAAFAALQVLTTPDDTGRIAVTALYSTAALVAGTVMWRAWTAANMLLIPNVDGRTGIVRWHTTYTGHSRIDTITGVDDIHAIRRVAQFDHQTVVLAAGNRSRRRRFHALGHLPTERFTLRTIRIPADQARALTAAREQAT
jgi:hypothetical protein